MDAVPASPHPTAILERIRHHALPPASCVAEPLRLRTATAGIRRSGYGHRRRRRNPPAKLHPAAERARRPPTGRGAERGPGILAAVGGGAPGALAPRQRPVSAPLAAGIGR